MNQRGEYRPVTKGGTPVVYEKDDVVFYNGGSFIALRRTTHLDGSPDSSGNWKQLTESMTHSYGENAPKNPNIGDEWYDTSNGLLFKFLNDGNSKQWVEIG